MSSSDKTYTIAVIGGGIAGAAVARDAALRGLSVIVFEKNTLGSGASSKSSKLIHGGIRYLELAWADFKKLRWAGAAKNFRFVFSSLRETRILAETAPDLVQPISLFVPIYRKGSRGPFSVYFGTFFYSFLSRLAGNHYKPKIFRGAESAHAALPLLKEGSLVGAVEIIDHTTDDQALVQAVADSAQKSGAVFLEHTPVLSWKKCPEGYELTVQSENGVKTFQAKTIVNASGAWIDKTRGESISPPDRYVFPVGGSHIELPAFLGRSAILEAGDGRLFFVIEKNGRARVGTTEWPADDPDHVSVPEKDVEYLLHSLARYFPSKQWDHSVILSSDAGLRPLAFNPLTLQANTVSREHTLRMDSDGVFYLIGVKLTDHRRAAEETVDRLLKKLGRKWVQSKTRTTPLLCRLK